ncbi:MAG: ROK family protein [Coprobacillaceae bacterium]
MNYACFDVGGTSIKAAILDETGKIIKQDLLEVKDEFEFIMDSIVTYTNAVTETIEGVAISAPGSVDSETGIIHGFSALPSIHGPNWKEVLSKRLSLPISIANDANCAAMAELFNGSGQGYEDIVLIVCGTGIGGAIIKNKQLHLGSHLFGGEFGYMILNSDNGEVKTYSDLASTVSIARRMKKIDSSKDWTGKMVFDEAEKGNQDCQKAIAEFYYYMAIGIYNIQHMYDPDKILLGGAISSRDDFIDTINKQLKDIKESAKISELTPDIAVCTHGKDANIIGALAYHLSIK